MYACDEGSAYCNCMYAKLKTNTGPHGVLDSIRPTARRDIKAILTACWIVKASHAMYACDEGSAYCNCMYAKLKTNTGPHGVLDSIRPTARRDIKAILTACWIVKASHAMNACNAHRKWMYAKPCTDSGPNGVLNSICPVALQDIKAILTERWVDKASHAMNACNACNA